MTDEVSWSTANVRRLQRQGGRDATGLATAGGMLYFGVSQDKATNQVRACGDSNCTGATARGRVTPSVEG
jgi:hypothetical protein